LAAIRAIQIARSDDIPLTQPNGHNHLLEKEWGGRIPSSPFGYEAVALVATGAATAAVTADGTYSDEFDQA
jgi:hypothetical protein